MILMKKNVLITGGTGFVGKHLTAMLVAHGFSVSILSRKKQPDTDDVSFYLWDLEKQTIASEAIERADFIIHLAGESIAQKRWTNKRKESILSSRVASAQLLYTALQKKNHQVTAFISASAVGIYGAVNGKEICTEEMPPADDFLGLSCQKWEAAVQQFENLGIRTVRIRTGLVLGENEGLLKQLSTVFKLKLGAVLGSGKQFMPWIHIDDLCRIYLEAIINSEMNGAYNAAITDDTNNKIFSKVLAGIYNYKIWLPNVPAFLIKLALGEMAKLVLTGRRISNVKIKASGFKFQFENLEIALRDCLGK